LHVELAGSVGTLDFNHPAAAAVAQNYGHWRRMTYFLLDALVVWHFPLTGVPHSGPYRRVDMIGAWQNGAWNRSRFFRPR
jgi:hypothetical protein